MSAYQIAQAQQNDRNCVALLQEGRLLEYYEEPLEENRVVGSLFLGRVERVLPDVKAAFVKIGLKQNGFLPLQEADSYHRTNGQASLMSGQSIIVQAKKAPKGSKGAFLSRDIALPGQYVLLMPCNRFVGLSKRIEDPLQRTRAQTLGASIAGDRFGVIVRHAALFASQADVHREADDLWREWLALSEKAANQKAPALLREDAGMADVLQRDYAARHELQWLDSDSWPSLHIEQQLKQALGRQVPLAGGGSLIIDEREALQTIDVNTGSSVTAQEGESLPLAENLRAVGEIARQIRLRNLSGIILVDFIDMDSESQRQQVLHAMEEAVADDRVKNVIHGFTRLGLLEMTRKRTGDSLRDTLTAPCSHCCEFGRIWRG